MGSSAGLIAMLQEISGSGKTRLIYSMILKNDTFFILINCEEQSVFSIPKKISELRELTYDISWAKLRMLKEAGVVSF
jgi:hypothetical protein